ncbi:putative aspartyl protease [Bracoviriform nigricipitis]|uniref:Putative aspartyl protease n=1 Tax=Bracoviriform nigricipitis TaxID=2169782 RepID=Q8QL56_9VIRU|nr:putative aspartyl protease [Bracoviriform nigricipitis]CAD29560.1 putative aspartyl protease [Bracoviriform nigricipitis]
MFIKFIFYFFIITSVNSFLLHHLLKIPLVNTQLLTYVNFNQIYFLLDTGSVVSMIPPHVSQQLRGNFRTSKRQFISINKSMITIYGEKEVNLTRPHTERTINWTFIVAEVTKPIMGNDLLRHYKYTIANGYLYLHDIADSNDSEREYACIRLK